MALLEVSNLGIAFGGLQAVAQLDLSIEKGHLYGLIGPNGAGKTTVFNMLTGVYKPTEGNIILDGKDITGKNPELISKAGVARTFQNIRLFNEMSVLDNVKVGLHNQIQYGMWTGILRLPAYKEKEHEMNREAKKLLKIFGLEDKADLKASQPALRRTAQAGDRPCPGHQPETAAAGRACRRYEPQRDRRVDADRAQCARPVRHRHPAHRARYELCHGHLRGDHRAGLRPCHRPRRRQSDPQ